MVFNLYLSLIELKINALEQASPLQDWSLPKAFTRLQRIDDNNVQSLAHRIVQQISNENGAKKAAQIIKNSLV